jgi:hypothetical protein
MSDHEMINRCIEAATVLNDGYQMLLIKTPINEIVIKVIEIMREPTEKMKKAMSDDGWYDGEDTWKCAIDCILDN